jgi:hypothetical protein
VSPDKEAVVGQRTDKQAMSTMRGRRMLATRAARRRPVKSHAIANPLCSTTSTGTATRCSNATPAVRAVTYSTTHEHASYRSTFRSVRKARRTPAPDPHRLGRLPTDTSGGQTIETATEDLYQPVLA